MTLPPVTVLAMTDPDTDGDLTRFEAWGLPRGNVVIAFPSRRVEAEFDTLEEAHIHAHQLNEWLERRPAPDKRYRMFLPPPEPTEARLIELIDQMLVWETAGCPVATRFEEAA